MASTMPTPEELYRDFEQPVIDLRERLRHGFGGAGNQRPLAALVDAARVAAVTDTVFDLAHASPDELEREFERALGLVRERVRSALARGATGRPVASLMAGMMDLQELFERIQGDRVRRRTAALSGIQGALSRLRMVSTQEQVINEGLSELCASVGFDRAALFRVEGSQLILVKMHDERDQRWADRIVHEVGKRRNELHHTQIEAEMVRRRSPALVFDPANDARALKEIIEATKTRSYVAAPVVPAGRVIGFLHADRYYHQQTVDELDRDLLWAFAEGFGFAVQRTLLIERLQSQRRQIHELVGKVDAVVGELCDVEVELGRIDEGNASGARATSEALESTEQRPRAQLTRRELEVLLLMAEGATNASIADRLFISPDTAKSHVKNILRKLGAANRAEAVSRYLRHAVPAPRPDL
jgi:DNA-binding CsgD family transcriptional regulator